MLTTKVALHHPAPPVTGLRDLPHWCADAPLLSSAPMRVSRADVLALLIALGAAIAGIAVWANGTVTLGMTLTSDGETVTVHDVTPGGLADRSDFIPGISILDLATTDGRDVERGDPLEYIEGWVHGEMYWPGSDFGFGTVGNPLEAQPDEIRPPIEAVEPARIGMAVGGYYSPEERYLDAYAWIDRSFAEFQLSGSIWIAGLTLLFAIVVWRLLAHGLAGPIARQHALVVAVAAAVPGLVLPVVQAGTAAGVAAGFLVPAAAALVLGVSLARHHPESQWVQTGIVGSLVAAALVAALVTRYLGSSFLSSNDPGTILVVIGSIGVAPAAIAASAAGRRLRERASLLSLGLVPIAAVMLVVQERFAGAPIWPSALVALLLGWYLLPIERVVGVVAGGLSRVRSTAPATRSTTTDQQPHVTIHEPLVSTAFRDALTIALFALVVLFGLVRSDGVYVVFAVAMAGAVTFAIRGGLLGSHWADAAVPLGAAVGIPIAVAGYGSWSFGGQMGWVSATFALAGLSVADVLAARHSDAQWRRRLLYWAMGFAALSVLMWSVWGSGGNEPLAFVVACLVPLVPGLPVAFAADTDEPRAVSARLETLAVALTLGVSALVLTSLAWVPLVAWLLAIVVWRRFTLAPLLGLAQRTQLQRDVAVAAAETERARLAADLHDDALQQLTMLVRTLDEGGQKEAADEAREIATKLRSVVGDLRLPILDDLGAGAALEWLVERVEPLAGGSVKLERSDAARPPANVELAVFRVAQEALTNAIKHGKPPIAVRYDVRADGRVTLAIDDAGEGIGSADAEEAPTQGHFGLLNMQQRAEQIGALLDVRRWPAGGTRVALEWRPQGS
jgi:signal transduction histidine kinase